MSPFVAGFCDELLKTAAKAVAGGMVTKPVESSNLKSIGYDPATQTMEVTFHSSGTYRYQGIPPTVYKKIMRSKSKGKAFHRTVVKTKAPFEKVGLDPVLTPAAALTAADLGLKAVGAAGNAIAAHRQARAAELARELMMRRIKLVGMLSGAALAGGLVGRQLAKPKKKDDQVQGHLELAKAYR